MIESEGRTARSERGRLAFAEDRLRPERRPRRLRPDRRGRPLRHGGSRRRGGDRRRVAAHGSTGKVRAGSRARGRSSPRTAWRWTAGGSRSAAREARAPSSRPIRGRRSPRPSPSSGTASVDVRQGGSHRPGRHGEGGDPHRQGVPLAGRLFALRRFHHALGRGENGRRRPERAGGGRARRSKEPGQAPGGAGARRSSRLVACGTATAIAAQGSRTASR